MYKQAPAARPAPAVLPAARHKLDGVIRRPSQLAGSTAAASVQLGHRRRISSSARSTSGSRERKGGGQRSSSSASFVAPSSGVPLDAGLRQLGGNAESLQGWRVLHGAQQEVGTVAKVLRISSHEAAASARLLRVERDATLEPYGHQGREVHHIPLVADIVPRMDAAKRTLYITPPQGLLEMGRRQLVLSFLKGELQQYAAPVIAQQTKDGKPLELMRWMPTRKQLEEAERHDLVSLITGVGSFSEVALLLGMRSKRRPMGYWEAIENLDRELSSFIAASWVRLPHPDSPDDLYYYNLATRRSSWAAPKPLPGGLLEGDEDGLSTRQERAADRVLPSRTSIQSAGRWDLHHAINYHGGYKEVAAQLKRRPVWPEVQPITRPRQLKQHLQEAASELGLPEGHMPSMRALRDLNRDDAAQAVERMGGVTAVSRQLNLKGARSEALDLPQLAEELHSFMAAAACNTAAAAQTDGGAATAKLPTHHALRAARRGDLLHALQVHGHAAVSEYMGLQPRRRGAAKGVLTGEAVHAALLAGCSTVCEITAHLAQQQQCAGQGTAPSMPAAAGVTDVWLRRRLSQWVAEGRIERIRRGVYQLPEQRSSAQEQKSGR